MYTQYYSTVRLKKKKTFFSNQLFSETEEFFIKKKKVSTFVQKLSANLTTLFYDKLVT